MTIHAQNSCFSLVKTSGMLIDRQFWSFYGCSNVVTLRVVIDNKGGIKVPPVSSSINLRLDKY